MAVGFSRVSCAFCYGNQKQSRKKFFCFLNNFEIIIIIVIIIIILMIRRGAHWQNNNVNMTYTQVDRAMVLFYKYIYGYLLDKTTNDW